MQSLGRYVNDAVKSLNAQKAIEFYRLKEAWMLAVGPVLAGQAEPTRMRGKTLHVTVSSPAWSQEIQLQQRLILERLKKHLAKAPDRIACWVGQPHLAPQPTGRQTVPEKVESQVPWARLPIPPERQAGIEKNLRTLADPALREKLRPLMELAVRRELYHLEQGLLPCPDCGAMRPAEQDSCDTCQREQLARAENRLMRLMAKKPWLKIRDLQDLAPWAGRGQILRLRKTLHSNLLMQAWQLSEGCEGELLAAKLTPEYRRLLADITMLRCYLPESSLKPFHYHQALGKRLASAMLGKSEQA